jgi:hypothetical protein
MCARAVPAHPFSRCSSTPIRLHEASGNFVSGIKPARLRLRQSGPSARLASRPAGQPARHQNHAPKEEPHG